MKKRKTAGVLIPRHDVQINQKAQVFKDRKKEQNKRQCRKAVGLCTM